MRCDLTSKPRCSITALKALSIVASLLAVAMLWCQTCIADDDQAYFITGDGEVYWVDKSAPSKNTTRYIRTVSPPVEGYYFTGLLFKDDYFYTLCTLYDTTYVIRFGLIPGDQTTLGDLDGSAHQITLRSDGLAEIDFYDSSSYGTHFRTLDLDTLELGDPVSPSPQFDDSPWTLYGITYDTQDRLIVSSGDISGVVRFAYEAATWVKNCNQPNDPPSACWFAGNGPLATDPTNGVIYGTTCGSTKCTLQYLTLPENPWVERIDVGTNLSGEFFNSNMPQPTGLAFGPQPPGSWFVPFNHFYNLSN